MKKPEATKKENEEMEAAMNAAATTDLMNSLKELEKAASADVKTRFVITDNPLLSDILEVTRQECSPLGRGFPYLKIVSKGMVQKQQILSYCKIFQAFGKLDSYLEILDPLL